MPEGIEKTMARRIFGSLAALLLGAAALLGSAAAWADPPGRVGRLADFSGTVWMFDAEQGEWIGARRNRPLTSGDRLSAERDARAELQIGSTTLRLDGGTELEVTELDDEFVRLHLHHGSLALRLRSNESAREFAVTTGEGRFEPLRAGHYRIDRLDDGSLAGVISGAMRFEASDSALEIAAGQRAEFWNERGVTHYSWSQLPNDRFADWVAQQDREDERAASRRRYVSPEMTGAEDLDRYGDWDRHPEYGVLWLPSAVTPGWAPYRYGSWAYVSPWGWTWVDDAPWGFAPFHYGRWVWWRDRWAWAPGQYVARPVYAPALVAWIGGPNFSVGINLGGGPAVGWVPLSPREHYVPTYSVTNVYVTNVNSPYRRWLPPVRPNQPVRTGPIMYSNQGVPGGVTVVPQQVLRERKPISNAVIAPVDARAIQRWQAQPAPSGNNGRRVENAAPPPPTPRVIAVPGGAVPAVPGAARATPWGRVAPAPRANVPATPAARGDGGDATRGRAPQGDQRGNAPAANRTITTAPTTPTAPAAAPPQRDAQERRVPPGRDAEREALPPQRRVAPAQSQSPAQAVPPGQAAKAARPVQPTPPQQPGPPVQSVRPAPAQAAGQPPVVRQAPGRDEPANARGRGPKDADERDDRPPPGQDRRKRENNQ